MNLYILGHMNTGIEYMLLSFLSSTLITVNPKNDHQYFELVVTIITFFQEHKFVWEYINFQLFKQFKYKKMLDYFYNLKSQLVES